MFKRMITFIVTNFWKLAGFYIWVISLLKVISGRDYGVMADVSDWLVLLVGGAFIMGAVVTWSGGFDEFKK